MISLQPVGGVAVVQFVVKTDILKMAKKLHNWSTRSQQENKGSPAHEQTVANKTAITTVNVRVWPAYVTINVTEAFKVHRTDFIFNTKCLIVKYRFFKETIYAHISVACGLR